MASENSVKALESMDVAQLVIKSLRSSQNARKNYQDISDLNPLNYKRLDTIIQNKKEEHTKIVEKRRDIELKLENHLSSTNSIVLKNQKETSLSSKQYSKQIHDFGEDLSSEDEEKDQTYPSSFTKTSKIHKKIEEAKRSNFVNNDDSDSEISDIDDFSKKSFEKKQENEYNDEDEDNDSDNQELFKDFVPPSNRINLGQTSKTYVDDGGQTSFSKTTKNQFTEVVNNATKKGIVIKPGQAIRVKPKGNRK